MIKTSINILGVNFGNSILDNSKSDKISEGIAKEIHIWNRVGFSLRGKNIIDNQTFLFKLWCIGQICTIPKHIKKEYTIFTTSQTPSSSHHLDECTWCFRHKDTIKLSKNKMDPKVIKYHLCSLGKSHAVSIEFNSEL